MEESKGRKKVVNTDLGKDELSTDSAVWLIGRQSIGVITTRLLRHSLFPQAGLLQPY